MATPIPSNTVRFSLDDIVAATGGVVRARVSNEGRGVLTDSRAVVAGSIFVAIRGETHDAHAYLDAARAAGASILVVEAGRPAPPGISVVEVKDTLYALGELARAHRTRWGGRIVGITGSAGKTTTKELCRAVLAEAGARVTATLGNLNNRIGVPMTLLTLDASVDTAVVEMGTSERGEIPRLGEIVRPDVAIVTMASVAHTQGLGTLADVVEEKTSLWASVPQGGTVIANADDAPTYSKLDAFRAGHKVIRYGGSVDADVRLVSRSMSSDGTQRCRFDVSGSTHNATLSLWGLAAALDAAAALGAVQALLGASALPRAIEGLAKATAPAGRVTPVPGTGETLLLDDTYNANPASTQAAIATLVEIAAGRSARAIAILGDMKELGSASAAKHSEIGDAVVSAGVSVFIGCGQEMSNATVAAARASAGTHAAHPTQVMHVLSAVDAVALAKKVVGDADVVLVKGSRSMGMERVVEALRREAGGAR